MLAASGAYGDGYCVRGLDNNAWSLASIDGVTSTDNNNIYTVTFDNTFPRYPNKDWMISDPTLECDAEGSAVKLVVSSMGNSKFCYFSVKLDVNCTYNKDAIRDQLAGSYDIVVHKDSTPGTITPSVTSDGEYVFKVPLSLKLDNR